MKKYFLSIIKACIVIGSLYLAFPQKVYAYLNPGTGSYIFQIIIGSGLMLVAAIKIYWSNIKSFFANIFAARRRHEDR